MDTALILTGLAGVLFAAAPIIFAVIGETITERAGVINLSLNGTILLSAMGGFAVSVQTGSLLAGFLTGAAIGAVVALVVAFSSITLKQSQVAVGFVLALTCRDLAYFLGNNFMGVSGPRLPAWDFPVLSQIPVLGPLFFHHDVLTYLSFLVIFLAWLWIFRTRQLDVAGNRTPSLRICARRECQLDALCIHGHRRRARRLGGTDVFAQRQSRWNGTISGLTASAGSP